MSVTANGAIPIESILKLTLDKAGASTIQDFLDKQEKSWGNVEQYVGKISDHLGNVTRMGLGLAGVAGVGAVVQNFLATSQAGSNLALAAGHVTGGAGAWHPYGQAMLSAQAATGVGASEIAQGLIMAVQSVGGNPTPQQAAVLGGLLAGYGQTVGMSPSQVAQVIAPILQASNRPLTSGNLLGVGASLSGTLTAFPGSQAAPMLGVVSQLAVSQALGSGPAGGFATDPHGLAAIVNAAAQTNSIFRSPSVASNATGSISGGLQNAYGNPSMEAFLQRAGISYQSQRQGLTPSNMQDIMREATSMYGTGVTRDLALRSMFGLQGADMLEALSTPHGQANLHASLAHHASTGHLAGQIHHAQQRTTPSALANRFGADILKFLETPGGALAGLAGFIGGKQLLSKAPSAIGRLLGGAGAEEGGASAAMGALSALGTFLGVGGVGYALAMSGAGNPLAFHKGELPVGAGWGRAGGLGGNALPPWMQHNTRAASITGGRDPVELFAQASKDLEQAAQQFFRGPWSKLTSGTPGNAAQDVSMLGVGGIQALGRSAPGMEFAALTGGGGGTSPFVSYNLGGGGGGGAPAGGQACTLTWYDPALGGINSGNGQANPNSPTASGQPYSPTAMTCAAPSQYAFGTQIRFSYGGKSVTCTVNDRGGAITGAHFDLSRGAFQALASISQGLLKATFSVISSGTTTSRSGGGRSSSAGGGSGGSSGGGGGHTFAAAGDVAVAAAAGAAHSAVAQVHHHHIYVDGRELRNSRVLRGHKA